MGVVVAWRDLDPAVQEQLRRRLTQKQLNALMLHLAGCGYDRIALMLSIGRSTARNRVRAARQVYDEITKQEAA